MNNPVTPVVTCTIWHNNTFLVIQRRDASKKYGGLWGFVGGKVEIGETIAGALVREVAEETSLAIEDGVYFLNSYYYGDSIGLHFDVLATTNVAKCEEGVRHKWLSSLKELQALPRIPGIDYHIQLAQDYKKAKVPRISLNAIDYTPEKYMN